MGLGVGVWVRIRVRIRIAHEVAHAYRVTLGARCEIAARGE